ncbi:hypothetical protein KDX38_28580 [Pseudomonas sp. CDFA 602]|uniref:hypothetical protein n=1 Tax=Pseudomonas californiensis TaxID=2829823 RepID=UPI001E353FD3|nr:hypothetical protein [Pseudomonas californiensis]MCD5997500.1 hypothetical protein [Pseudomonas californiensis]MCD6003110.1 hypothetical protein [Pseudomonas californiensis]
MEDTTPKGMRYWEAAEAEKKEKKANNTYVPALFEGIEFHSKQNHETFRHAPLPFRSQFWLVTLQLAIGALILFSPIMLFIHMLMISVSSKSWQSVSMDMLLTAHPIFIGIPLICWLTSHIVVNHFPRVWLRPPKGPSWELNRRTGLVTIFDYKNFKKTGVIDEFLAPFYEFDAYMIKAVDRHGSTYGLLLRHRYEDRTINFHMLVNPDDFKQRPCAWWDFFQNYMNVSGPLPDIPLFEPYRHLDPVTAEYDKKNGRNPRYWIDMNEDVFKAEVGAMWKRTYDMHTFGRPNLMARYVDYND